MTCFPSLPTGYRVVGDVANERSPRRPEDSQGGSRWPAPNVPLSGQSWLLLVLNALMVAEHGARCQALHHRDPRPWYSVRSTR